MKVLRDGFTYEAENFDDKTQLGQIIKFVQKEREGNVSILIQDGTTIEELLDIIISRVDYLQQTQSSSQNFFITHYLKLAKFLMIDRQQEKNKRLRNKNI